MVVQHKKVFHIVLYTVFIDGTNCNRATPSIFPSQPVGEMKINEIQLH